ncbi:MAG: DUF4384 domain-containing protein [Candidatus Acetothermia bacterium]|nr:DUF4384 domain-containing protein [Candidatus Acetothermia bacterium]
MNRILSLGLLVLLTLLAMASVALPDSGGKPAQHNPRIDSLLEQILQTAAAGQSVSAMDVASRAGVPAQGNSITVVLELAPQFRGPLAHTVVTAVGQAAPGLVVASSQSFVKLRLPLNPAVLTLVDVILRLTGVAYARPPAVPQALAVTSEGVQLTGAAAYQSSGLKGRGVKIAVIDLGFAGLSTAQSRGELPTTLQKFDYTGTGLESGTNHGTAVAEIVYDMAPEAELYLMKIADEVDLERAKDDCIRYGIQIVNHSIGWFNTNFYDGQGAVAQTAADARAHGIVWVNAAGNYAQKHWKGYSRDGNANGWNEFSGSDEDLDIQVRSGETIQLYLTWNDWPASAQDYDLYLFDGSGRQVALSDRLQTGTEEPIEQLTYRATTAGTYKIKVKAYRVTSARELALFSLNHDLEYPVPQGSIVAPADSASVIAVGAIHYASWTTGPAEPYSSQGPTGDGRSKPDISGPDQVQTSTLGRFMGTSAAAPHVAGAAALLLSETPSLSASQLEARLRSQAIAMGSALIYGAGRLNLTPQLVQRPDLVISSVNYTPQSPTIGSQLAFTVQVKNQGNAAAGSFAVEISDSLGRESQTVAGLVAGQTATVSFTRQISQASQTYTFTADAAGQVTESDETNNSSQVRVSASSPPSPPATISITIWTDSPSYAIGARLTMGFEVHPKAYVYIYNVDSTGLVSQIFPNSRSRSNYIEGRYTLPDGAYVLTVSGPAGREYLHAVASAGPIDLGLNGLRDAGLLDPEAFRAEVARRLGTSSGWATAWTSFQAGQSTPGPSNRAPVASFTYSPSSPIAGQPVSFDGSGSSDPDGRITSYSWDFNADGRADATGATATYTFSAAGSYRVTLTVTDNGGLSGSTAQTVEVRSATPSPSTLPTATLTVDRGCGSTYQPGERITVSYSVSEAATVKLFDFTTAGQLTQLLERSVAAGQTGSFTGQVVGPAGIETLVLFARTSAGTITTTACTFSIGQPGASAALSVDRGSGGSYRPGETVKFSYSVSEEASVVIYDFEPTGVLKPISLGWTPAGTARSLTATIVGPAGVETAVLMAYTRSGKVVTAAVSFKVVQ